MCECADLGTYLQLIKHKCELVKISELFLFKSKCLIYGQL